ncbi:tripartite tricarboxylate transporter substrate-binding protein, partial [Stenotrophomonas maltophilia]|uniref:tripartite tricarboxylate transporter substrate-binding protein n=1 Tax=Stenotrophomonas maltophilia TaxID=40324 RepID=UPI0023B825AF
AQAVSATRRSPSLPTVPTPGETRLAGYDANIWGCILAPAGTPRDIVPRLNREINAALEAPDVRTALPPSA